jgi:hypothetical protein
MELPVHQPSCITLRKSQVHLSKGSLGYTSRYSLQLKSKVEELDRKFSCINPHDLEIINNH